ncbi:G-protein coupled receptor 183-A [Electrophorus electricus]|uniref:G-protein coupled receptors family 1 profile domain-containing protein n=1 Tax=Electrophorus electricus TaxID=8005 RepID=A0A4W4EF30_ELEEL|nr:G-protein coupled receptor 183-A [Electrophorus electricus]
MVTTNDTSALVPSSSNCTNLYDHSGWARVFLPTVYFVIFVAGLLGNMLALHVIWPNTKKINSTTLYSANLVVSDILFSLTLPLRVLYYALGFHWPLGEALCKASALLFYLNVYAGVNFMTCLSVDRFVAVVLPLRFACLRQVRTVRYVCAGVWALVLAQTLTLLGMPMSHKESDGWVTCMEYPSLEHVEGLPIILICAVLLGYGLPLVTILACYSALCFKLRLLARTNQLTERSGRSRKAIGVICCVILVYVVCYSPYHIDLLQYMVRKLHYEPDCAELHAFQISLHITVCLMNLNSCLDPFIYFFACKGYKKKMLKLLRRQISTSFSSVARTSPEGSSRDVIGHDKIQMNSRAYQKVEQRGRNSQLLDSEQSPNSDSGFGTTGKVAHYATKQNMLP